MPEETALPARLRPIAQRQLVAGFALALVAWTILTSAAVLLAPGDPSDSWFLLMVISPMVAVPLAYVVAVRRVPRLFATLDDLDLVAITAVQGMRFAGVAMLALWAAEVMNPLFAAWAGGLDVLIGLTAVPIALTLPCWRELPRRRLRLWHLLGILDFVIAIPIAVATSSSGLGFVDVSTYSDRMFTLPLSFIPMVGVPFTACMHLTALIQLRECHRPRLTRLVSTVEEGTPPPPPDRTRPGG